MEFSKILLFDLFTITLNKQVSSMRACENYGHDDLVIESDLKY